MTMANQAFLYTAKNYKKLQLYTVELEQAKKSQDNLRQVATYMILAFGELHPITAHFMQQSAETAQAVIINKQLVS